jgi:hypothetical protein
VEQALAEAAGGAGDVHEVEPPGGAERRAHLGRLGAVDVDRRRIRLLDPLRPAALVADADLDAAPLARQADQVELVGRLDGPGDPAGGLLSFFGGRGQRGARRGGDPLHAWHTALEVDRAGHVRAQGEGRDRHQGESRDHCQRCACEQLRAHAFTGTRHGPLCFSCRLSIPSLNDEMHA